MKKIVLFLSLIPLMTSISYDSNFVKKDFDALCDVVQLFDDLTLQDKVSFTAFQQAVAGYAKIDVKRPILTLIDFSKASTEERFFVIDMEKRKLLFESHVAHGRNSGSNYTTSFSNTMGSHQSSLGFFITENSYQGRNGLSLVLDGLEKGINDNAKPRAVVIHGADYANPNLIPSMGRLGRSFGCPALPRELTKPIIETIKNGSLVFAFSEKFNESYLEKSSVLN
jgi:hypothetical protein